MKNIQLLFCGILFFSNNLIGYGLLEAYPGLNLGRTNFLDGGPIRPKPGWYWFEYSQYYHTTKLLDANGCLLDGVPSPEINAWDLTNEVAYQNGKEVLSGNFGINIVLPVSLIATVSKNNIDVFSSGSGLGNFFVSPYWQSNPIVKDGRDIFVHRLNFGVSFPTGKNKLPEDVLNPGGKVYVLVPYWAATLFFTEKWAASWRFHYIWLAKNHFLKTQAGDAALLDFSMEYEFTPKLWIGINGYFLQQLHDNRLNNVRVPDTKERVLGLGPGMVYFAEKGWTFFFHFYAETDVRNRPKGINFVVRFVKYF